MFFFFFDVLCSAVVFKTGGLPGEGEARGRGGCVQEGVPGHLQAVPGQLRRLLLLHRREALRRGRLRQRGHDRHAEVGQRREVSRVPRRRQGHLLLHRARTRRREVLATQHKNQHTTTNSAARPPSVLGLSKTKSLFANLLSKRYQRQLLTSKLNSSELKSEKWSKINSSNNN